MVEVIECPFCKTKVAPTKGVTCPACGRDLTDQEAVRREERIDDIYELIWQQYRKRKTLRGALDAIRRESSPAPDEIDQASSAFLEEARRKYLYAGRRHAIVGLSLLAGGLAGTMLTLIVPLPITIILTGAITVGVVDSLYGVYQLLHYWRYFVGR